MVCELHLKEAVSLPLSRTRARARTHTHTHCNHKECKSRALSTLTSLSNRATPLPSGNRNTVHEGSTAFPSNCLGSPRSSECPFQTLLLKTA